MLDTIFKKDSVKKFFNDLVNGIVYKKKDIPYTISDEKMDVTYYAILMGLDAIIKYEIIIEKEDFFDSYLQEVQLLLRKVDNHNELKTGINKLIVNYCQKLLNLKNITTYENKEIILKHIQNAKEMGIEKLLVTCDVNNRDNAISGISTMERKYR